MNPSEIRLILNKVVNDITYIQSSPACYKILELPTAHSELSAIASEAEHYTTMLKLRVVQALDKCLDNNIDMFFKDVA